MKNKHFEEKQDSSPYSSGEERKANHRSSQTPWERKEVFVFLIFQDVFRHWRDKIINDA